MLHISHFSDVFIRFAFCNQKRYNYIIAFPFLLSASEKDAIHSLPGIEKEKCHE